MDKEVKETYKTLKKIVICIQLLLKKEKVHLKTDELILKISAFINNEGEIKNLLSELNLCIIENNESQKCVKEIKNYVKSLNKVKYNSKENMYYLLTADEYLNEILKFKKTRNSYIQDKYREGMNSINGIQYYNPNSISRNDIAEKIKTFTKFIKETNPINFKSGTGN